MEVVHKRTKKEVYMLNDVELQARIDNFLHRKEVQFPELAQKSDTPERPDNEKLTSLRLGARPSN